MKGEEFNVAARAGALGLNGPKGSASRYIDTRGTEGEATNEGCVAARDGTVAAGEVATSLLPARGSRPLLELTTLAGAAVGAEVGVINIDFVPSENRPPKGGPLPKGELDTPALAKVALEGVDGVDGPAPGDCGGSCAEFWETGMVFGNVGAAEEG